MSVRIVVPGLAAVEAQTAAEATRIMDAIAAHEPIIDGHRMTEAVREVGGIRTRTACGQEITVPVPFGPGDGDRGRGPVTCERCLMRQA